jgi:hypothetical protein
MVIFLYMYILLNMTYNCTYPAVCYYSNNCCNLSTNAYDSVYSYSCLVPKPSQDITFITNIATANTIPSGGTSIPAGTVIAPGTTTVPTNTVTVINGYTGPTITNVGGIILFNGFFNIPENARFFINTTICFAAPTTTAATDFRELYIYQVAAVTGLVTTLADDSRVPIAGSPTCINISAAAQLNAGDRIFVAARQSTSNASSVNTIADMGRFAIMRIG